MKIVDVKTYMVVSTPDPTGQNWSFVKIVTDEGIEGIGEGAVPFGSPTASMMMEDMARDVLIGADNLGYMKDYLAFCLWHFKHLFPVFFLL